MRVAYYSPLPPERSGIADYSALLLPALAERIEVEVAARRRRLRRDVDVSLYHLGNDPDAHGWIVEALRARPGVVVLHEWVLHHLVAGLTLGRRDVATYLTAMERDRGLIGRLIGLGVVDGCLPRLWEERPDEFPLAAFLLDESDERGAVVHSRYVEERVQAAGYAGPVWRIPHPAWPIPDVEPADLGPGPVVGSIGHLNLDKRIPELIDAFARVRERVPEARLLLAGPASPRLDLPARLRAVGLDDGAAIVEAYVDEPRLWALIARCDVCVNLRYPTMGETSGMAVRALRLGRPLVVSDVGWFAELPDDAVVKVAPDEHEAERLAAALELLLEREDARTALGTEARRYAEREHDVGRSADLYAAALEEAAGGAAVRHAVASEVARAAADVGLDAASPESAILGERLSDVGGPVRNPGPG
jgi:glycosyltransferase involved in cell wall biosynthesis